jgi:hypothetical protein
MLVWELTLPLQFLKKALSIFFDEATIFLVIHTKRLVFTRQLLQLSVMDKAARAAFRQRIEVAEIFGEKE